MVFECRLCGSCCMYLGDYIVIDKQTGPYSFTCSCVSTGTEFSAHIDPDKQTVFDDRSFPEKYPSACRFLRPLGGTQIGCTIHADSPAQCKYYRCVIMNIETVEGEKIGIVTGTLALHSDDANLQGMWSDIVRDMQPDDPASEEMIRERVEKAGYRTR